MRNKSFYQIVLLIIILVSCSTHADDLPPLTHNLTAIKKPIPVKTLRFQNMDDETVDIKDLHGKVVVINFWATWCPPCRREMGSLERLHQATKDKGVEVIAVNIGEDLDTVFSFMGTVDPAPSFQMIFDPEAVSMKNWKVRGLPTTYIINPDGTIAFKAIGGREFDHPEIQKKVIGLIN